MLIKVNRLGKILRASGRTTPPFDFPQSRSDQTLLTVAWQFAREVRELEAHFAGHGMSSARIACVAAAFEEAICDRWSCRADYAAARARIHELLSTALLNVCRLDLIVDNELGRDNVIQAVWRQARRIERRRSSAVTAIAREEVAPAPTLVFEAKASPAVAAA